MIDRRVFLKSAGLALVSGAFLPGAFARMAAASTSGGRKTLVVIFQRGAIDGLSVVVPYAEGSYRAARPTLALGPPGRGPTSAIDLDGSFGLHPALEPLLPFFRDRSLGFVHAAGSPDGSRSHFDAQDFMESGTPGRKSTSTGFLARSLEDRASATDSPLRAVAFSPTLPRIFAGSAGAIAMTDLGRFGLGRNEAAVGDSFAAMYGGGAASEGGMALDVTARDSFAAVRLLKAKLPHRLEAEHGARYPSSPLGRSLLQLASLIKADVGLEVGFTDVDGWDTHVGQAARLDRGLGDFARAVEAFLRDLGSRMGDVVLLTMSEFGRTVRENGNRGTDHGHGTVMVIAGGGVKGGQIHGRWPGLEPQRLHDGRDLAVTTDFRDVCAAILAQHLGVSNLSTVFPGYTPTSIDLL